MAGAPVLNTAISRYLTSSWGNATITRSPSLSARPSEDHSEDPAQRDSPESVFDDTNPLAWNKFSGYDRGVEGGHAGLTMASGMAADFATEAMRNSAAGGRNSVPAGIPTTLYDPTKGGDESGLDRNSHFGLGESLQPLSKPINLHEQNSNSTVGRCSSIALMESPRATYGGFNGTGSNYRSLWRPTGAWIRNFPREGEPGSLVTAFFEKFAGRSTARSSSKCRPYYGHPRTVDGRFSIESAIRSGLGLQGNEMHDDAHERFVQDPGPGRRVQPHTRAAIVTVIPRPANKDR